MRVEVGMMKLVRGREGRKRKRIGPGEKLHGGMKNNFPWLFFQRIHNYNINTTEKLQQHNLVNYVFNP